MMRKKLNIVFTCLSIIVAIMCVIYGIMIFSMGYGTKFFLVWIALGVLMGALAWAIRIRLWQRLPKWSKIVIISIAAIGLIVLNVVEGLICSHLNDKGQAGLDYVIVLGALVYEDGPSSILRARLDAAIEYLNENPDTICIVSGGQGANEPFSEAEGMSRYLVSQGIDDSRIIKEGASNNTIQNIVNSKALIDAKDAKVGIVSSNFHLYRAIGIARKQGLDACGIAGYVMPAYMPSNMLREFFGVVKDTLLGNM